MAEDQPFFHIPRNREDPHTRVDISSGSASFTASQLIDQEAMSRKNAAAARTALSLAEYIDNYPGMPEGARAVMLLLKLDIISCLNYAWREAHNKMLLRRSIALDCLRRTLPPIDDDQKLALLHASFKGTTLFAMEGSWPSYRKRTRSMLPPSQCSLSQQRPLHLILLDRMSDEVGVLMTGRALRNLAGEAGDRAGPRLPPRVPNLASLKKARKVLLSLFLRTPRNVKWSHETMPLSPPGKPSVIFEGTRIRVINNEGVLPHNDSSRNETEQFCGGVETYNERSLYVLSIVAERYRLRFTSPPLLRQTPWEIRSPQGPEEILGMREQITLMLQKNAITEVPPNSPGFYSNVFLVRKASGGWRPVIDLKNLNAHIHAPHFRMFTTNSVLSSV